MRAQRNKHCPNLKPCARFTSMQPRRSPARWRKTFPFVAGTSPQGRAFWRGMSAINYHNPPQITLHHSQSVPYSYPSKLRVRHMRRCDVVVRVSSRLLLDSCFVATSTSVNVRVILNRHSHSKRVSLYTYTILVPYGTFLSIYSTCRNSGLWCWLLV
jgi:hypothetical protein